MQCHGTLPPASSTTSGCGGPDPNDANLSIGAWSDTLTATTKGGGTGTGALPAPTGLTGSWNVAVPRSLFLAWKPVENAVTYDVQHTQIGVTGCINECSGTTRMGCTIDGPARAALREIRVRAHPASSDTDRSTSDWSAGIFLSTPSDPGPPRLGTPTGFNSSNTDATTVSLTWTPAFDIGQRTYEVRLKASGGDWEASGCGATASFFCDVTGLTPATEYSARVRSVPNSDEFRTSDWSTEISFTTLRR